ncbi:hypothetical protein [Haloarcula salina]|uniref:DUF8052 domain-containing protein n=1 Tax=Haloarcula salina TaxID=1429914 RepID=A0AA41G2F3_9EURY|nr:hypothetical protein [Haloarcula salina]MBV0902178.1 hypothetical protein [Haloarcula salina]
MSGTDDAPSDEVEPARAERPEWDDQYVDAVADRLAFNYDLERDHDAGGERFDLYGRLTIESQKQVLHQSLNWANYETVEHLFARRVDGVSEADLDALVDLGHDLAEERIDADEEHHGTEFTFVLVAPRIPESVREFVSGFRDRTLLKYGYYGAYEVNLVVVAPDREDAVASAEADVAAAFELWRDLDAAESRGLLGRLRTWLG